MTPPTPSCQSDDGRRLVVDLARTADIFVHSMKPGGAERRGLRWGDLRAINPKLVCCAISAFGAVGPLSGLPGYAQYELFPAADGTVFIAAGNDRLFAQVCQGLGAPSLSDDPRFETNPDRVRDRAALSALTRLKPVEEIVSLLRAAGVPCSELNSVAEMLRHPQVAAAEIVRGLSVADHANHRVVALRVKIDGARGGRFEQPPGLGANTDEILRGLGYDDDRLAAFRAVGAIT